MILEEIREQTQENHVRLERSRLLEPFGRRTMDTATYLQLLQRFYGYFYPLEQQIDRFPGIRTFLPDYDSRRKSGLLLQDWQRVSGNAGGVPLSLCTDLPSLTKEAHAFGCLYVMEGSTLGGKLIAKVLHDTLGLTVTNGAAFFHGYGSQTGARWKSFGQALVNFSEQTGQHKVIIETANQTFEKLAQWIKQSNE